jgi:hypothetical protein
MESKLRCACCGYNTIESTSDVCPVCYWQKDDYQEQHSNDDGGPNLVSLMEAKENYKKFGAIEERFKEYVRLPTEEEK